MTLCPCTSGLPLEECCGPLLDGAPAATAEALMRSRYTAFVLSKLGYLDQTLVEEKRETADQAEVAASSRDAQGLGLEIRATAGEGDEASVEYVAKFRVHGQQVAHHELAQFRRQDGRWLYVDGEMNPKAPPRQVAKVGRNDPCPCGSGQKYKKCCGA